MNSEERYWALFAPPRRVPLTLRLHLLFGTFVHQFGWFILGFMLLCVQLIIGQTDYTGWYRFWGRLETVNGQVTKSEKTSWLVEPGQPAWRYHYRFERNGVWHEGNGYSVGGDRTGQEIPVEFKPRRPQTSRLLGDLRRSPGSDELMILLFLLIGGVMVFFEFRGGLRAIGLLAFGELAEGHLVGNVTAMESEEGHRFYRGTYEYKSPDGEEHRILVRDPEKSAFDATRPVPLLYNPKAPRRRRLLRDLPGRPSLFELAELKPRPIRAVLSLVLPAAVVLGHGTLFALRFLGWRFPL